MPRAAAGGASSSRSRTLAAEARARAGTREKHSLLVGEKRALKKGRAPAVARGSLTGGGELARGDVLLLFAVGLALATLAIVAVLVRPGLLTREAPLRAA